MFKPVTSRSLAALVLLGVSAGAVPSALGAHRPKPSGGRKLPVSGQAVALRFTASATSAPAALVSAPPPTASFTFSPASPVTGQAVSFDASGSTCPGAPCTYTWSDDGGVTRPIPPRWPLGGGQLLQFTFAKVGTKYVRLVVTDAAGAEATVEHNVVVGASSPPPAAPAGTAPPVISGTATEGQTLTTSNGSWSNAPTSYTYQWQDCNGAGQSCTNVSGATTSSYGLAAADVGHTIRVVVTATNSGGSTPVTSASVGPVSAPPPTASFAFSPASPVAGQAVSLDASGSTCPDGPCTYAWSDDGGLTRPIPPLWPLGAGQSLQFTFAKVGTKYVRLVVTDAAGAEATVEHNVVVGASSPPVETPPPPVENQPPPPVESPPPPVESSPPPPGSQPIACFGREEACGYPGPEDTGVEKGSTLSTHTGSVIVSEAGTTLRDERIEGNLEIAANNVTVENVEVVTSSQRKVCEKTGGTEGGGGLTVVDHGGGPSTGVVIRHVTVHGVTQGCPGSLGEGISMRESSSAADVKVEWSKVYWTRMCFFQSARWENNYCDDNGALPGAHYDGIYANGEGTVGSGNPGLIVKHNTILMPHWQTAPLFLSNEKEVGEEHIEDNLLAGGGYLMYLPGAHGASPTVKGPVVVSDNRYARCSGKTYGSKAGGHHLCEGLPEENEITSAPVPGDSLGYFPSGGSYGVLYSVYNATADHLSGNYWDDNLEAAP